MGARAPQRGAKSATRSCTALVSPSNMGKLSRLTATKTPTPRVGASTTYVIKPAMPPLLAMINGRFSLGSEMIQPSPERVHVLAADPDRSLEPVVPTVRGVID